jgi:ribosomal protein S13
MTKRKTMTRNDAREVLTKLGITIDKDYHQLTNSQVDKVVALAVLYGYHKSKNAPGSKGRMFFQFLQRAQ